MRDPIYLGHEPLNRHIRLKKSYEYVQFRRPLHGEHFTHPNAANGRPREPVNVGVYFGPDVRSRNGHALQPPQFILHFF